MFSIFSLYNKYFSSEKELANTLYNILGFTPRHLNLYKRAFSHKSLQKQKNGYLYSNERLEYLGDSVLSTIVAEYLFSKYPTKDEGFMTKMRSKIVKRKSLNEIAIRMGIGELVTENSSGVLSNSMMGNALEALIGALYLDLGYDTTKKYVITKILMKYIDIHQLESLDDNHKSTLLEWGQKLNKEIEFSLLSKIKQNKRDYFTVAVNVEGSEMGVAQDFNKKAAEQLAAKIAIKKLNI